MKKIFIAFLLIIGISLVSCAQSGKGVVFKTITMEEAQALAAKENKLIFIDVYTTWCPPCKYMTENIFSLKEVGEYFNGNFVNVKFDAERGEGISVAKNYQVTAYPTFLILDTNGKEVGRIIGRKDAEEIIKTAEEIRKQK
ncbi:MAG: thioredoxin family protein [Rikenellaceae bacterium]|nr:thioredoxin family protein [Rikenellaceae bacterium]